MYHSYLHPTLYMPATLPKDTILGVINRREMLDSKGRTYNGVWRAVICTEDAVAPHEVPVALDNVMQILQDMDGDAEVCTFLRARNPEVLARILEMHGVEKLTGFVVPKADSTFPRYADQLDGSDFKIMPILESQLMVDHHFRENLRSIIYAYKEQVDCLRIGANDMMGYLGIRRDPHELSVFDGPVGQTIYSIINEFGGIGGFSITAPVFECIAMVYDPLLRSEVRRSIQYDLFGQTVIHPRHLRIIRDMYRVDDDDYESAKSILDEMQAVRGLNGRMDEYTTHWRWAKRIMERKRLFGLSTEVPELVSKVQN
jgi:citrate lyase beta subunit